MDIEFKMGYLGAGLFLAQANLDPGPATGNPGPRTRDPAPETRDPGTRQPGSEEFQNSLPDAESYPTLPTRSPYYKAMKAHAHMAVLGSIDSIAQNR